MRLLAVFLILCLAVTHGLPFLITAGTHFVRTPSHDSAIIKSDRLGGNFAYSTVEGHAYAAVTPIVQNVAKPVAVSQTVAAVPVAQSHVVAVPPVSHTHQPLSAYALESATLPKEHRGLTFGPYRFY